MFHVSNVKSCFLGKIRKNIINLSSAEFANKAVKVKSGFTHAQHLALILMKIQLYLTVLFM